MAVDQCRVLEIGELCDGGRWASHPRGRIRWVEKGSKTVRASLSYAIAWEDWPPGAPLLLLELRYHPTPTAPESCDRIRLEVGAARRCVARCPGCDRPVRKLYAPPSDAHFFCRDCQGLVYRRSVSAEKRAQLRAIGDDAMALEADLQTLIGPLPGGADALAAAGVAGGPPAEQQHDELEALLGGLANELPLAPQELRIYCLRLARFGLSVRGTAALVGCSKSSVGRFRAAGLEGVSIWLLADERRERLWALRRSFELAILERRMLQRNYHRQTASDLEVRVLTVAKADPAAASKQEISAARTDTRLGRQEIPGEPLAELPGALWKRSRLDKLRVKQGSRRRAVWQRLVVAIEATSSDAQETGIIVAALGLDDHCYVLGDHSGRYPVERWGALAVSLYQSYQADYVVAGANNAGKLVRAWLGQLDPDVPVSLMRANYGSDLPAEPVSALYDQSRVHHIGAFPGLEDEMVTFIPHRTRNAQGSATRVAALAWAITELVVRHQPKPARSVRLSRR